MVKKGWKTTGAALALAVLLALPTAPVQATETIQEQAETQENTPSSEEVSKLLDFVKEKWDAGDFKREEDIRAAIEEGEAEFGVTLDDSEKEQLADAVSKLDSLGMDHDTAIGLAKKLYREHGDEIADSVKALYDEYGESLVDNAGKLIQEQLAGPVGETLKEQVAEPLEKAVMEQVVEPAKEAAKEAVQNTAKTFWNDLKDSVISFFQNIFS